MAAPAKLLHIIAFLGKEEATYGTAVGLATTADGLQLQYTDRNTATVATMDYAFDGKLGPSIGSLGQQLQVTPSGLSVKASLPTRARGGGAAYSATVVPSLHRLLKTAGFDATVTTTGGSEKWVYTPTAGGGVGTSLCGAAFARGEAWGLQGLLSDLKIDASNPAPPIWTFDAMGLMNGLPIDGAPPAITYPLQTVQPAIAAGLQLALGGFTTNAAVLNWSFALARTLTPRVIQSASGAHLGFVPGDRVPVLTVELEATALVTTPFTSSAGFDPYRLRDTAQVIATSIGVGTVQYNKYNVAMANAQVTNVTPGNNGSVATVKLEITCANSTATSGDDLTITFN